MAFWNKPSTELISIHIPKTAGTSFRNILKSVYGNEQVARFDISMRGVIRLHEKPYHEKKLPPYKVLHGHFSYDALNKNFVIPQNCPVITWLRNPVQRVISNYYYLESQLIDILKKQNSDIFILEKMQKSLIEFARVEVNRNRISKYLNGIRLEDLTFIGIQEYFEEDILKLARILHWKSEPEVLYHNITESTKHPVSNEVLEEIKQLNLIDIEIYEKALKLRQINS